MENKNNEWRLPSRIELENIHDQDIFKNTEEFQDGFFWSSTSHYNFKNDAWGLNFVNRYSYYHPKGGDNNVILVRNSKDGLELLYVAGKRMSWYDAIEYAETLSVENENIVIMNV